MIMQTRRANKRGKRRKRTEKYTEKEVGWWEDIGDRETREEEEIRL